jgi:hypothetical protein
VRAAVRVDPDHEHDYLLVVVERHGNEWRDWSDGPVMFVPLVGEEGWT